MWQGILIDAVSFAASASIAGYGAVLTTRMATQVAASVALRASITAAINVGQNVAKSSAAAAMSMAMKTGSTDGRDVYMETLGETIDRSTEAESNTLAANMNNVSSLPIYRWGWLQVLYDDIVATRADAQQLQYNSAIEGWMSASSQGNTGVDFQIGDSTLTGLYRQGRLTLFDMQGIQADLQMNSSLSRVRPQFHTTLATALGANWQALPVIRVTSESLATRARGIGTSSVGTLKLYLTTPQDGDDPHVDSVEIESQGGINNTTRAYFLQSRKKIEDFNVSKLLMGDSWSVSFDEQNHAGIRVWGVLPKAGIWLAQFGARKLNQWQPGQPWNFNDSQIETFRVAATAFLRYQLMTHTLNELGVTSIKGA